MAMQDLRQNNLWKKYCETKGWKVFTIPSADGKHKMQGIIFSIGMFGLNFLKLQRSKYDPDWKELAQIRHKNWVVSSIIEPLSIESSKNYREAGYRRSNFPYLATKTIIIDITKKEDVLWRNLSENTRRLINKNKEVTIKTIKPDTFLEYWKKSAKIWTLNITELENIKRLMKSRARFLLCLKNGVCHSGLLILESKDTANYFHTFTTAVGRQSGAHYKLVWESILEAKRRGMSFYDFEGIFDQRWPQKRWLGFTEFKKKFGGSELEFPGCFHRWL